MRRVPALAQPPRASTPSALPGSGSTSRKRGDDEQTTRAELAREKLQEQEGGRVGGMQIVEDEHERSPCGGPPEEFGGRVEEAEARDLGARCVRSGQARQVLRELGQQLCELGRPGAGLLAHHLGSVSRMWTRSACVQGQ